MNNLHNGVKQRKPHLGLKVEQGSAQGGAQGHAGLKHMCLYLQYLRSLELFSIVQHVAVQKVPSYTEENSQILKIVQCQHRI